MAGGPENDHARLGWMKHTGKERWITYLQQYAPGYSYSKSYKVNSLINSGLGQEINDIVILSAEKNGRQEVPSILNYLKIWRLRDHNWRLNHGHKMENIITYCIIENISIVDVLSSEPTRADPPSTDVPVPEFDQTRPSLPATIPKLPDLPPKEDIRPHTPWYSIFVRFWNWLFG